MSERGLVLALQRLHDDPGFVDLVAQDPQSTLGIYDLEQEECDTLIQAVQTRDGTAIRQMASKVGVDWTSDHIQGVGALGDQEVSIDSQAGPGIESHAAQAGDGYEGVKPLRPAGT
ncbi:MAG TPA: hypothetical protein VGE45_20350 [Chloroflexia bacterium]|jgi:hypothetical protein